MAKFNKLRTRAAARSAVVTASTPTGRTYEGGPGFDRDAKSELFLLAVANTVGDDTFYEAAPIRDERYGRLVATVAREDPDWMARFVPWLRGEANMRSAAMVAAVRAAHAMVAAGRPGSRPIVASALQRADEPGEALAYWLDSFGRTIPKPVKRGIADAAGRLYTEYSLLRYDTAARGVRFGDVVDLTHPVPTAPWQGDLFAWALARRHRRDQPSPASLPMVAANAALRAAAADDPRVLLDAGALRAAGFTWEDALSRAGSTVDKAALWSALIPSMGYMALLRNLRNFDEAGVPDDVAQRVAARLGDPAEVAASRQFPFRFLAAHRASAASLRWAPVLERALQASLANVPRLTGRTLVLVDLSGSMNSAAGGAHSRLTRADVAKLFGAALALRGDTTLVWFDHSSGEVRVPRRSALLPVVQQFPAAGGGTDTGAAVRRWYDHHNRVVIVTDEQAHYTGHGNVAATVPPHVPVYTWNLGGYRRGHAPSGSANRHTFGGLTDQAFRLIPLLERAQDTTWPF
jgi:hypothetical protein